jgi:co-chaperonin GroES (HSP10)
MKAIGVRILLKVEKKCDNTCMEKIGEFSVPVDPKMAYWQGEVLSVGSEVTEVKEGDKVLIYPEAGKEFVKDGEIYRVITTSEVIVVL